MRYMLDTNICIYAIKHKPERVFARIQEHDPEDICIAAVTYAELMHGVEKPKSPHRNLIALSHMLANIEIISFDIYAAASYVRIRADLERQGTTIGVLDTMIAGHARSLGCTLVTNNMREFERIKDLKLENWAN